jgi:hypothetical protein
MRRIPIGSRLCASALVGAIVTIACIPAMAESGASAGGGTQTRSQVQERVYGSDLMTQQERTEYRARIRSAKTEQERERIRQEHRARMTERARERGITLPDQPGAGAGPGRGPGAGFGPGAGPGGGRGGGGKNP